MMNQEENNMVTIDNEVAVVPAKGFNTQDIVNTAQNFYCSVEDDGTRESKLRTYKAVSSADHKLDDFLNKPIAVKDVVIQPITLVNDETGEIMECMRSVLIGESESYESVSEGVLSSLQTLFGTVGVPTWEPPVVLIPREVKTRKGRKTFILDVEI